MDEPAETDATLLPELPEWDEKEKLAKEKEVLGFYLTSHPLSEHLSTLASYCSHTTAAAAKLEHRTEVMLGGLVSAIAVKHSKRADPGRPTRYAMFDLEDTEDMIRCICWPEQFVAYEEFIKPDAIVVIRGVVDKRPGSDEANLIVNEIIPLADLESRYTRGVLIRVDESQSRPGKTPTAPRNPPRLPRQGRTATNDLPGRRQQSLHEMLRLFAHHQRRNAHPRGRSPRPRQLPPDNRRADGRGKKWEWLGKKINDWCFQLTYPFLICADQFAYEEANCAPLWCYAQAYKLISKVS